MPIDTAEKRRSAGGVPFLPLGPGVTPNASKDQEWRQQAAWSYSGILAESEVEPGGTTPVGAPRWPITLHMYESRGGALIYTFPDPVGLVATDNEHGYESLTGSQKMQQAKAFWLYDLAPAKWMELVCGSTPVWEGRLEGRALTRDGFGFTALGAMRALSDAPYMGLWSTKSYVGIRQITEDQIPDYNPHLWAMDNNNRIYIEANPNNTYLSNADIGGQVYYSPYNGEELIQEFSFDYDIGLPTDWEVRILLTSEVFATLTTEWTFTSAGTPATGSVVVTPTALNADRLLIVDVRNNTGAPVTGAVGYAKISDVRIKGTTSDALYADEIVKGMVDFIQSNFGFTFNPNQLSSSYALIQSPGVDLDQEVYDEDTTPAEILNHLVEKGDDQDPPRKWEWGVWEDQLLFFRPRGDAALHWYVDADDLTIDSTLDSLYNHAVGVYQDTNGRTIRTSLDSNGGDSYLRYGIRRRAAVPERTTSLVKAEFARDTFVDAHKDLAPRASLTIRQLYGAAGERYPLWCLRSGDIVTMRNLPPTLSVDIDKIRTFRVVRKSWDVDSNVLTVTPEFPLPDLALQVAGLG